MKKNIVLRMAKRRSVAVKFSWHLQRDTVHRQAKIEDEVRYWYQNVYDGPKNETRGSGLLHMLIALEPTAQMRQESVYGYPQ